MIDKDRVLQLIELLKESSSMELAVREDDMYVRVKKAPAQAATAAMPAAAVEATPDAQQPQPGELGGLTEDDLFIRARLVGRFWHGKGPGQPSIVNIGDSVAEDQVIATIEALGKITGVPATEAGDVIEFLTADGEPVHYGTPLVRLRRKQG